MKNTDAEKYSPIQSEDEIEMAELEALEVARLTMPTLADMLSDRQWPPDMSINAYEERF